MQPGRNGRKATWTIALLLTAERKFPFAGGQRIIPDDLAKRLEGMIGFRNVLVHEYQRMDIQLMVDVIENQLDYLLLFID
jgi:hypothetical protein